MALVEVMGRYGGSNPARSIGKRAVDVAGAVLVLLFFAPIGAVLLIGMRLSRGGPVLAREPVVGLDGRVFGRWRLHEPEQESLFDLIAWRAGLNCLPSALNVIVGQMSLIGPRPHSPEKAAHLTKIRSDYALRFEARPGMIWPRDAEGQASVEADLDYVSDWTAFADLRVAGLFAVDGVFREPQEAD